MNSEILSADQHTQECSISTTDLAIGRAMAAMVVKERHLWINLADIGEKEKHFLLDAQVSPSELFGTSVEIVVDKFREARSRSAAYKKLIPRRPGFAPNTSGDPGQSGSAHYRQAQRQSVGAQAPPPPAGRSRTQKKESHEEE